MNGVCIIIFFCLSIIVCPKHIQPIFMTLVKQKQNSVAEKHQHSEAGILRRVKKNAVKIF